MKELIIYSATWCQPCQALKRTIESTTLEDTRVIYVDIDKSPAEAQAARVRGVPTLLLFEDGELVKTSTGAKTTKQLLDFVETSK